MKDYPAGQGRHWWKEKEMHRLISCAAALAVLTLTAAGEPPTRTPMAEAALQKALAGRTPGKPESCVSLSELGSQRIIDRNTILFEGHGGRIWRNDLRHRSEEHTSEIQSLMRTS